MTDDEPTICRSRLIPAPACDETTMRASVPPEEERTLVDLYRPEPTFEVQVLTNPDGLPIVSVRPMSRRENTSSRRFHRPRPAGDNTRLAVKSFRRSLRWKAVRAWVLAFGLGGSAMAGAVAVLFFAGLLPGYELQDRWERRGPTRSVADGDSVLTMREPRVELDAPAPAIEERPAPVERVDDRRSPSVPRRSARARRERASLPNAFTGAVTPLDTATPSSRSQFPRLPPAAPLGISDSAGF